MGGSIAPLILALSVASNGGLFFHRHGGPSCFEPGGQITPPGPGLGWGYPNGNPDGYGWVDYGTTLPIHGDRITDYYARRYMMNPASQTFMPTYFNPYVMRGQRYIPYAGCGGEHPFGGMPVFSAERSMHPFSSNPSPGPVAPVPNFTGEIEAPAIPSGTSGMIP